ncbi:hypothetical protein [Roseibium sp.]|uniref:hypothetical protein n=1 Tax=Roseibium sp. TaxID=1936156 RepID=UPI00391BB1B6
MNIPEANFKTQLHKGDLAFGALALPDRITRHADDKHVVEQRYSVYWMIRYMRSYAVIQETLLIGSNGSLALQSEFADKVILVTNDPISITGTDGKLFDPFEETTGEWTPRRWADLLADNYMETEILVLVRKGSEGLVLLRNRALCSMDFPHSQRQP